MRKSNKEIGVCIFLLLLPILFLIYGSTYKQNFLNKEIMKNPYTIRIVGSNISLDRFYENSHTEEVIDKLIKISSPDQNKKIFFLWPEGIIPNVYQDQFKKYKDKFSDNFNKNHLIGLGINSRLLMESDTKYYNSFSTFDSNLNLINSYNKINLVPFGEFLPFESLLNKIGLEVITNNLGSFTNGELRNIIIIENNYFNQFKFLPLICYEIIYSGNLSNDDNFDFIFNISEDGWFGKSIGPKQHFTHGIFRAIESGKYVLRSSNNGMSAIINPIGEIEGKIDYGQDGFIDFYETRKNVTTIFSQYGNKIFFIIILLYIFLVFSFNRIKNE